MLKQQRHMECSVATAPARSMKMIDDALGPACDNMSASTSGSLTSTCISTRQEKNRGGNRETMVVLHDGRNRDKESESFEENRGKFVKSC